MDPLNLPPYAHKVKELNGKPYIYDSIRKKFVRLSPEEWVRQHVIELLHVQYHHPKSLMAIESGLQYNRLSKRSDILVLDSDGAPFLLVECKAPHIAITPATFAQISRYNFTLLPRYLAVTNGLTHHCFSIEEGQLCFHNDFPAYQPKE